MLLMKRKYTGLLLVIGILSGLCFFSCQHPAHVEEQMPRAVVHDIPQFATGFRIVVENGFKKLIILSPWVDGQELFSCYIVPDSINPDLYPDSGLIVRTPLKSVISLSATQWMGFVMLDGIQAVKGISEASFVTNNLVRQRLDSGEIIEVASNASYKPELMVGLKPDAVLYSPFRVGIPNVLSQIHTILIPWPDYFENDPLGRAEWIKVCGVLLQKSQLADSIFDNVVQTYDSLRILARKAEKRPTIFADKQFSGQWHIPGGQSYVARLFADANAQYLWADNESNASFPLDIETIVSKAAEADFWRIAHAAPDDYSYDLLAAEYELYKQFKAFQNKKVIFCNTFKTAYFEKGTYEPHKQLADLIYCMHPELLPDYQPVYYQLLQ